MGHAHTVCALQVDAGQVIEDAQRLRVQAASVGRVAEVQVAGKKLVSALTRQHDLGMGTRQLRKEVVGDRRTDQLRLIGLKVIDHLGHDLKGLHTIGRRRVAGRRVCNAGGIR